MKNPAKFNEQIQILKDLWFIINDEEKTKKYLKHIWFYRLSHYFNYFLWNHNWEEKSFDNVLKYYIFDRKLKLILSDIIERIEISIKANIIDTLSLEYNNSCFFMDKNIYFNEDNYNKIIEWLEKEKSKNKEISSENLNDIDSWKLFQWLTFWTTVFFYWSQSTKNKKLIANNYDFKAETLHSWLLWLTDIRNICAHYDKLWWTKITRTLLFKHPKLKNLKVESNTIFSYILVMHFFLKEIWIDSSFLDKIEKLFNDEDYKSINKEKMGFSENWRKTIQDLLC